VGCLGAKKQLKVSVPPKLFAGGVATRRAGERRPGPAALTARHVRHVATVHLRSHVAPHVGETAICLAADDDTLVLVDAFADAADPVEEHLTRILRLAERKMNVACSNG
jgi:hypothetical protein